MYNPLTSTFSLPRGRHAPNYPVAMTEMRIQFIGKVVCLSGHVLILCE